MRSALASSNPGTTPIMSRRWKWTWPMLKKTVIKKIFSELRFWINYFLTKLIPKTQIVLQNRHVFLFAKFEIFWNFKIISKTFKIKFRFRLLSAPLPKTRVSWKWRFNPAGSGWRKITTSDKIDAWASIFVRFCDFSTNLC